MHSPYMTSEAIRAESNVREAQQRSGEGGKKVIKAWVESTNPGTGAGRHYACFVYDDGTSDRMEGKRWA